MINAEMFLRDYWQAKRSIGRLMLELTETRAAYELGASNMRTSGGLVRLGPKRTGGESPVERAAILLTDELGAEVKSIEKRLADERQTMARVESVVAIPTFFQIVMDTYQQHKLIYMIILVKLIGHLIYSDQKFLLTGINGVLFMARISRMVLQGLETHQN